MKPFTLSRVKLLLGTQHLSKDFLSFAKMHSLYNLSTNLSGVFIGTFLLKSGSSLAYVGLYYFLTYFFEPLGGWFSTLTAHRLRKTTFTRISLVLFSSAYLILILLRDNVTDYFPAVAFLTAIGNAFYWMPFHGYCMRYSSSETRQHGVSFIGVTGNLIALLSPPLSGFIIAFARGFWGYIGIFAISIAAFVLAALVTGKMPSEPNTAKMNLRKHLSMLRIKALRSLFCAHVFFGMKDGVFLYYLNMLIFSSTGNELILGINMTARSILTILMFTMLSRLNATWLQRRGVILAGFLSLALYSLANLWFTIFTVILLSVLDTALHSFNGNALQILSYRVTAFLSKERDMQVEVTVARNYSLNLGRCIGLIPFLFLPADWMGHAGTLILVCFMSLPWIFFGFKTASVLGNEA